MIAGGHSTIIGDAKNWPSMRGRSFSGTQRGSGSGERRCRSDDDVAQVVGAIMDTYDGRAVALRISAIAAPSTSSWRISAGRCSCIATQWCPDATGSSLSSSRRSVRQPYAEAAQRRRRPDQHSPIGDRFARGAVLNGKVQAQEVAAASGFSAQSQRRDSPAPRLAAAVDRVVIRWPSGATQTIEHPAIDQLHKVRQGAPDGR